MDFDASTLTFDLQNLIRSSVGGKWIFSDSFIKIVQGVNVNLMRYHGNNICPDERTNERQQTRLTHSAKT